MLPEFKLALCREVQLLPPLRITALAMKVVQIKAEIRTATNCGVGRLLRIIIRTTRMTTAVIIARHRPRLYSKIAYPSLPSFTNAALIWYVRVFIPVVLVVATAAVAVMAVAVVLIMQMIQNQKCQNLLPTATITTIIMHNTPIVSTTQPYNPSNYIPYRECMTGYESHVSYWHCTSFRIRFWMSCSIIIARKTTTREIIIQMIQQYQNPSGQHRVEYKLLLRSFIIGRIYPS